MRRTRTLFSVIIGITIRARNCAGRKTNRLQERSARVMTGNTLVCKTEGVHGGALSRGRTYEVVDHNPVKSMVRVRTESGRLRWFHATYFEAPGTGVVTLKQWTI